MCNDLVSIIVPIYNTEKFLPACIESLRSQTYKNIEIILVDDGSSDNSPTICKKYTKKDSRIKFLYSSMYYGSEIPANNTQAIARNAGIQFSKGDWIMFLDSDDTFSENAVEEMLKATENESFDIGIAPFISVFQNKTHKTEAKMHSGVYTQKNFASHPEFISWPLLCCIGNKIYKKSVIDTNSIWFDKNFKYNEDGHFMLRVLNASDKIAYIDCPFYQYRIRKSGSTQSTYRKNVFPTIYKTRCMFAEFLKKNDAFEGPVIKAYAREIGMTFLEALKNELYYGDYLGWKRVFYEEYNTEGFAILVSNYSTLPRTVKIVVACQKMRTPMLLYSIFKLYNKIKHE